MEPIKRVVLAILACSSPFVYAETPFTPLEPLSAELELGIISTSGNTESAALKGKATIKQDFPNWKNKYLLDTLYKKSKSEGEDDTKTTAQKIFLSAQSDYKLNSENSSVFVYGSYTGDRFSGYEYQNTLSVGYSGRLLSDDDYFLDYSLGPGYSFSKTDKGEDDNNAIVHIELQYDYTINSMATFQQFFSSEVALQEDKNSRSKSETSFSVKLRKDLSMKAAYSITHNSDVPNSKKNTDATTSVIFAYNF